MKKRSAMLIAGAAVAVLLAASAALSLGLLGAGSAAAGGDRATPRVRTIERTVTIHKKKGAPAGTITYAISPPTSRTSGSEGDDGSGSELDDEGSSGSHEGEGSQGFEDD